MRITPILLPVLFLLCLLFVSLTAYGSEVIEQVGVATPQSPSEEGNIEVLRQRAIRNAEELAIMQVTGAVISDQKGDAHHFMEVISQTDDKIHVSTRENNRFRKSGMTKTDGYVRLVEIVREWQTGKQYWVKIKAEVSDKNETNASMNAGFYWQRSGKPGIALEMTESVNGNASLQRDDYTLRYLRDNLINNGIDVSSGEEGTGQYLVKVDKTLHTTRLVELDTYTTQCRLMFRIVATDKDLTVAEYRAQHGPQAGFSQNQTQEDCIKKIAPEVSENLVRKIATLMNDRWNKGVEYRLVIEDLPPDLVTQAGDVVKNLFQVSGSSAISYSSNTLHTSMFYKAEGSDLAVAVQLAFDELGWKVEPQNIQNKSVILRWISRTNQ